ncbi:uncharacterized protein LOC114547326 isoform X1 [Perca flavescens]|uniref:uncharacterized protein LOC114547326 isoform X1 n=2 Tax=Perca flavescens TaxID=8167 RepID=UPI00106E0C2B|nr:uncharacterized protein LOC114547326 isoform X1 [Perca flavescens]
MPLRSLICFCFSVSDKNESGEVSVRASCFRSMRKSERPHNLSCSCVAGLVLCNHIAALLYQTSNYSQQGAIAVPPTHSCTGSEQQWHKPRTQGFKPGPTNEMVVLSARPKERRVAEGIRSNLYKGACNLSCDLPDMSVLRLNDISQGMPRETAPLITTMGIAGGVPLVDSAFGKVQEGSVLSYHLPAWTPSMTHLHVTAPPRPSLPLDGYSLGPSECCFVLNYHQQLHMKSLETSEIMAHQLEESTRQQSTLKEWHLLRKPRVTSSRFREVCHVRGQSSAENLALRILRPGYQTAELKRGLQMEPKAVEEYCLVKDVNHYPCGFIIHPDAPWLGSSPDGLVYNPNAEPAFGLLKVKCPNVRSYVDCTYLRVSDGVLQLKTILHVLLAGTGTTAHYWSGMVRFCCLCRR